MTNEQISLIKDQIDHIQEYIDTDLCKKCEEMKVKLDVLKEIVMKLSTK